MASPHPFDPPLGRPRRRRPRTVEPRRTAPELAIRSDFFRDLVGSMRNSVIAITLEGRLVFMNADAYRTLGLVASNDDIGRHFSDVVASCPDMVRVLNDAFTLQQLPNRAELRVKSTGKVIGYTLCHVRNGAGDVTGAALLFKDLTRVEQLEERERLRDRLAALGEMAAAIAHEVKNPLAGIEVMAGLLKRRVGNQPDAHELLNDIIHEAKMANAIVIEVLDYVRPIRLQLEPVPLGQIVDEAVHMAEAQALRGAVGVHVLLPHDLPPVDGDAHQLRQVFTNLLSNAYEALNGRGRVIVRAQLVVGDRPVRTGDTAHATGVAIEVTDDGPGVPEEVRDRIFAPFFTTKPRGSGLGLSIVRKIVDAHDGKIDLVSGPQGGTTFRVTLPITRLEEAGDQGERDRGEAA
ncbi:MAG: hypothetical protein KJ061_11080 [Vicinamibacteraceae bacterium]|nr:hypothetical protein [Vicinamibacteraceae bacterium]